MSLCECTLSGWIDSWRCSASAGSDLASSLLPAQPPPRRRIPTERFFLSIGAESFTAMNKLKLIIYIRPRHLIDYAWPVRRVGCIEVKWIDWYTTLDLLLLLGQVVMTSVARRMVRMPFTNPIYLSKVMMWAEVYKKSTLSGDAAPRSMQEISVSVIEPAKHRCKDIHSDDLIINNTALDLLYRIDRYAAIKKRARIHRENSNI